MSSLGSRSPLQSEPDLTAVSTPPEMKAAEASTSSVPPAPEDDTLFAASMSSVERFLNAHELRQYIPVLHEAGYEDVEDLVEMVFGDVALFKELVPLPGHRAKIMRLLRTDGPEGSPSPFKRAASRASVSEPSIVAASSVKTLPRVASSGMTFFNKNPNTSESSPDLSNMADDEAADCKEASASRDSPSRELGSSREASSAGSPGMPRAPSADALAALQPQTPKRGMQRITSYDTLGAAGASQPRRSPSPGSQSGNLRAPNVLRSASHLSNASFGSPSGTETMIPIILKTVVVGQGGAGKSSFVSRLVKNEFNPSFKSTLGVEFSEKKFRVGSSQLVTMQMWDIMGQENCSQLTRTYYNGAKGAIVMYDVSEPSSLVAAVKWKQDIDAKVKFGKTSLPVPCLLVGNKSDLPQSVKFWGKSGSTPSSSNASSPATTPGGKQPRATPSTPSGASRPTPGIMEEIQDFCNEHRFTSHFFVSAKTGEGVRDVAEFMVNAVLKMDPMSTDPEADSRVLTLDDRLAAGNNNGSFGESSGVRRSALNRRRAAEDAEKKKKKKFFGC